jgi:hypothetical protein
LNRRRRAVHATVISPTHKRAEGRAPVWGSEFTVEVAKIQGDLAEIAATLNVKFWVLVIGGGGELPPPLLSPILFSDLFESSRTISNLAQRN